MYRYIQLHSNGYFHSKNWLFYTFVFGPKSLVLSVHKATKMEEGLFTKEDVEKILLSLNLLGSDHEKFKPLPPYFGLVLQ